MAASIRKHQDLAFILLLIAALFLNLWRAPYGFCSTDESFYVTIAHRLYLGDALVVEEWHPSQFAGVLMYPVFWAYMKIHGSTDGILLFFRYFYVAFNTCTGIFLYRRTRNYGFYSVAAAVIYMLYTLGGMMATNYNTIGLSSMIVVTTLVVFPSAHRQRTDFIAGFFFAMAALCVPTMAIFYLLLLAACLIVSLIPSLRRRWPLPYKRIGSFTAGICILALLIVSFMLSRASLSSILHNFPNLFLSDREHTVTLLDGIKKTLYLFYMIYHETKASQLIVPVYAVLVVALILDRQRQKRKKTYLLLALLLSFLLLFSLKDKLMLPLVPLGLVFLILDRNMNLALKRYWLIGLLYCFLINLSSDTIIYATSMAASVSTIAVILMMADANDALSSIIEKNNMQWGFLAVCVALAALQIHYKAVLVYGDQAPEYLQEQIASGPAEGLHTDTANAELYRQMQEEMMTINSMAPSQENVLLYTDRAWMYLMIDHAHYATYSTWMVSWREEYLQLLDNYYQANPQRLPDIVYIPKDQVYKFINLDEMASKYGLTVRESDYGYLFSR